MAPTEKTCANVADKNKCIVCLKKAIKGPKVIQCVSCVNTAHVECVVRSKDDLDDYKCEDCVSESANSSTETVIENSEKDIDLMVKEREGMLIEIDLLKRLLKEVEEKNALLYYKINVLEDKISNYENLSTISSPSPVLTNRTQTRSTRGAFTRAAKKTSVKDQPLVTKKSSSTVLPESERASTSTNGRQQMEPGLTEAVLVEHTDTCEGEGEVTQINASNLNNTAGADSGCGSHDTGWTNVNRRRKRTAVIGSSKDMGNIKPNFNFILCGDFNVDPIRDRKDYKLLTDILDTFNLVNIVSDKTRNSYVLDHMFTNCDKPNAERQDKSWISDEIRVSSQNLKNLHNLAKVSPEFGHIYRDSKRRHSILVENTKRLHYDNIIKASKNPAKVAWNIVNSLSSKGCTKNTLFKIREGNNTFIEDTTIIANKFNNFFAEQPKHIIQNIAKKEYNDNITRNAATIFLHPFVEEELISLINRKLKSKASSGFDEIPSFIIKRSINVIVQPLVYLVNMSFAEGNFPDTLKVSKITPVFKKGDVHVMDNYRPIALSPAFSKIFEYCYLERLTHFLQAHKILIDNQFGFRSGCNTNDAIHGFIDSTVKHIESGEFPLGIFCDLSKAFDCVSHEILLIKAEKYGIRGKALDWMKNFLSNRSQYVSIKQQTKNGYLNNTASELLPYDIGVPQGSILGPMLFILFINDITDNLDFNLYLFADDATASICEKNTASMEIKANKGLEQISEWFDKNLLYINPTKSNFITFHNYNSSVPDINIIINDKPIQKTTHTKFLGVTIDEHLNWKMHCEALSSKLNSVCFLIRNLRNTISPSQLLHVYHALISSRLRYGICFWGTSSAAKTVFLCQKRIVRTIAGVSQSHSCRGLFQKYNLLSVPSIALFELAVYVYKNHKNLKQHKDYHDYFTRNEKNFIVPCYKYRIGRQSPMFLGIKVFNKLNDDIKYSKDLTSFKNKLKILLLRQCYYSIEEFLS
nr:unnamed protein product [Callosobruchus analis]